MKMGKGNTRKMLEVMSRGEVESMILNTSRKMEMMRRGGNVEMEH